MIQGRRSFLRRTLGATAACAIPHTAWRRALRPTPGAGMRPYGPLGPANALGVRLPAGFHARLVAMTGVPVGPSGYVWHGQPDGGATFADPHGGWLYVANAELNGTRGGVGVLRFAADGALTDAYAILSGTKWNCAGGATPWGTWLSCEEHRSGLVWECDPFRPGQGLARPALGRFAHEAAVVDPATGYVYLTEDDGDSRFYRFRPLRYGDLSAGVLEAAAVATNGAVTWLPVAADRPHRSSATRSFARGEGAWYSDGFVYFATTADHRVWALETAADRLQVIYDAAVYGPDAPLREPDNVTVHAASGDIYVAEDDDDLQLVLLADQQGRRLAAPFLQLVGHAGSEIAGPAFSPDGRRLYFSSQRGMAGGTNGDGMTFEVTGPFRGA